MIITRTPHRISLAGGGTDFPEYYREHGGAVIGFALDRYVWVTARELPPFFEHKFRCVWSEIELVRDPSTLRNPIYRAALTGWEGPGLELHYDSDLPARSGLGSSSAFAVGLLLALRATATADRLELTSADRYWLAALAIRLEREDLNEPGGLQDQIFSAYGGFNRIDFAADSRRVTPIPPPSALFDHLLLFYVGQARSGPAIEAQKIAQLPLTVGWLDAIKAQVDVAQHLLRTEDYLALGALLTAGWELKQRLAPGVSSPVVDAALATARNAGAWGGKLLGAGGAGFILLCAPRDRHAAIRAALAPRVEVPVGLSLEGATAFGLDS